VNTVMNLWVLAPWSLFVCYITPAQYAAHIELLLDKMDWLI
jgi:hypothetical protein